MTWPLRNQGLQIEYVPDHLDWSIHLDSSNCPYKGDVDHYAKHSDQCETALANIDRAFEADFFPYLRTLTGI